ncbi:glutathione transferase GstA [Massilia antarctica]|uniref:glutathione transferase GstA n=1 Tax=Massilia antarctica TaxID=2765360 RepID=UPI0006BB7537|nr:glutathione transferase GstA [Massilia sp. H27-R4]MCY0910965.1 glutathione transferase GstA [Massilia sp. H27-R4]CUI09757.1 Glutathione S-transferase [Janthinobacterium sp. CG23_2]CUU33543.1 Glutathione S-transferase [Janthinobacterium sp. CG23_2]
MKLYFSPGACSLSPHIVLLEAGLAFTTDSVDLRKKVTASGADFSAINPKGYVPALETDQGMLLTEGPAIVQYLADLAPEKKLAPAAGTPERYVLAEWLNFISTELHKNFSPLFRPNVGEELSSYARANLTARFGYVERMLKGRDYLTGSQFTVADAYLFTVLNWANVLKFDMSAFPLVQAFQTRVGERPLVQQALRDEGLLK